MMETQHHKAIEGLALRMKAITESVDEVKSLFDGLSSENKKLIQMIDEKVSIQ